MPTIDDDAKRWQEATAARIGQAVQRARKARGMTVQQLADRTRELGYPMHRVALGKIESGNRAGKLDTSELLILAKALDVQPLSLLYGGDPGGDIEVTPGVVMPNGEAALDFCVGDATSPLFDLYSARGDVAIADSTDKPDLILSAHKRLRDAVSRAGRRGWSVDG